MELDLFKNELPSFINPSGPPTFSLEDSLPSLPLPALSDTLELYLACVRPFVTQAEFAATVASVREFESTSGRELHRRLVQRARDQRNWLADWWLRYAYLANRSALHPLLNMAGVGPYHRQYWPPRPGSAVDRAAAMCRYYAELWCSLRDQTFVVDKNSAGKPMSMQQFRRYFSACQIPGRDCDTLACHFRPRTEGPAPRHLVVLAGGRQFVVDLVDAARERPYPTADYHRQLTQILATVRTTASPGRDGLSDAASVASLLGLSRPDWAEARSRLAGLSPANVANLDLVEQAVFVLSLLSEAECPAGADDTQLLRQAMAGDLRSVWADKSCNLMVTTDGLWLNNCGHTPMDGMTVVVCSHYVECQIYRSQGRIDGLNEPSRPLSPPEPRELRYALDARLCADAARGIAEHAATSARLDAAPHDFVGFGKTELRRLRLHPDTVVQLALQLAYWRAHGGRPAPTYQTATTRQFFNGRTETIRSCTAEAVAMCRVMAAGAAADVEAASAAVWAAHNRHNELRSRCESGLGCDRHLLGLQVLALESGAPAPALFADPAYAKSGGGGNFVLSTSHLGYATGIGCVAPMCKGGYGIFYRIGPARIAFNMTRWAEDVETSLARMSAAVDASLADIRRVVAEAADKAAPRL